MNLAVPKLSAALRPSSTELLWIVDIYGFVLAGALIPMGVLGDRIGRRRLLLIGAAAFGCASVFAAFAPRVEALIAARALLGLAAATLAPSTLSLLRSMFLDPKQRTFAVGVWIASFSAGGAIGPLIGGVLLQYFWWGSVFLINLPVMVLLLAVGPKAAPRVPRSGGGQTGHRERRPVHRHGPGRHLRGQAHRRTRRGLDGGGDNHLGLVIGAIFLRRQRKLAQPFIDLGLFRRVTFSAALAVNIFGFFVAFGTFLLVAQYFQLVIGLSPLAAGLWSAPSGIAFVVGAMLTPRIVNHIRPPHVIAIGFVIAALGFGLLTRTGTAHDLAVVATAYAVFSLGLAPVFTLATDLIVSTAPPERAGAAAGISEMSAELGGALGIALLGSVVTFIYRANGHRRAGWRPAAGCPCSRARHAGRRALGGGEPCPSELGTALVSAARSAFVDAFQATALASAAITLIAAVATALILAGPRQSSEVPPS